MAVIACTLFIILNSLAIYDYTSIAQCPIGEHVPLLFRNGAGGSFPKVRELYLVYTLCIFHLSEA